MSKMKEYDLFIPVNYNSGLSVELEKLERIKDDLIDKFRGLSVFSGPCEGYWREREGKTYRDRNLVFRVVAEDNGNIRNFMKELKFELEVLLQQQCIFIIVRDVEIL